MLLNSKLNAVSDFSLSMLPKTLLIMLVVASGGLNAGGIVEKGPAYTVPANLTSLSTQEVENLHASHNRDLAKLERSDSKESAEENLLSELMTHDLVRLSIIDVIPQLIEDYKIEGEFKDNLLGYRSTFLDDVKPMRDDVISLDDYQSYDFRFAAVYMSMLFSFQAAGDFHDRLKADMEDEATTIGGYKKLIDESYDNVKKARAEMDVVNEVEDLKNVIAELDNELKRRNH